MSNVILDHIFTIGNAYKLSTIPHKIHKHYEELKELLGTEFKFLGPVSTANASGGDFINMLWKSVKNDKVYAIRCSMFIDSNRFYSISTSKPKDEAKALLVLKDVKIKSLLGNTEVAIRIGTIFTKYKVKGSKALVTADNGKEYSLAFSNCCEIMDIEGTKPLTKSIKVEQPLEMKKDISELAPVALETKAKELNVQIEEVHVYNVLGLSFNSKVEAEAALRMYKHLNA